MNGLNGIECDCLTTPTALTPHRVSPSDKNGSARLTFSGELWLGAEPTEPCGSKPGGYTRANARMVANCRPRTAPSVRARAVEFLCCPVCAKQLQLESDREANGEVESGRLICGGCFSEYPIVRFVPRFAPENNYADNFSLQWNTFRKTQLDSHTGVPVSRERFFKQTEWDPDELRDKLVLDVGCGAGRFVEVLLSVGARIVALDYSAAVDACWANLGPHPRLTVIQGDIYALPFPPATFDYVYCFGVLQHTPDVRRSFMALPGLLRPGGRLAVDMYFKSTLRFLWPKYWFRPLTTRLPPGELFRLVEKATPPLLVLSNLVSKLPIFGRKLRYLVPVANYRGVYPLSEAQHQEFSTLDTFDMFSPAYDQPQTAETLRDWFSATDLTDTEVFRTGQLVGRGVKPLSMDQEDASSKSAGTGLANNSRADAAVPPSDG